MTNMFLARILVCTLLCIALFTATPADARVAKAASLRRDVDHLHFAPRDIIKTDAHRSLRSENGVKDRVKAAVVTHGKKLIVNAAVKATGAQQALKGASNYMGEKARQANVVKKFQGAKAKAAEVGARVVERVGEKAAGYAERNKAHEDANTMRGYAQRAAQTVGDRYGATAKEMREAEKKAAFKRDVAGLGETLTRGGQKAADGINKAVDAFKRGV